jgi:serine/threonine protein kinase
MAPLSIDEFVARLESARVLDEARLEAIRKELAPVRHEVDTECYANKLVKEGTLTQWQWDQLLAGRKHFVVGEYRLLELAGRGGMGAVFKAEHIRLKRIVALKTLNPELVNKPAQVARFQKEIQAASALESPHVVRALDAAQAAKTYILIMEFVDGEPLSKAAKRRGRLPIGEACEYIRQAALGLQHAHERGMVHRDIKPGNLILTWKEDGAPLVKVFDLGLARFVSERVDHSEMTRTGQVMGTPDYMSPEQGWDTRTVDIRGDIYSLGCTAFRLITGRVPFHGDNPLQTLMVRCSTDAPPIRSFLPEVTEPLEAVVAKMLARDPAERFQTPGELAEALAPFCETVPRTEFQRRSGKRLEPVAVPTGVAAGSDDEAETGYGKFLNTLGGSTSVDVLAGDGSFDETLPDADPSRSELQLDSGPSQDQASRSQSTRQTARRSGLDPRILAAAGLLVCCLLGGLFWMTRDDGESPGSATAGDATSPQVSSSPLKFFPIARTEVDEGRTLQLNLRLDGSAELRKAASFRLSGDVPDGMTLHEKTGELTWLPSESDGPGQFQIAVEAWLAGQKMPAAKQTVTLDVNEVDEPPQVAAVPRQSVVAGEQLRVTIAATDSDLPESPLRFQLAPGAPSKALIDPLSGMFEWTPPANSAPGRQTVLVLVSTQANPKTHSAQTISIDVKAAPPQFRLAALPDLKVTPGETLRATVKALGAPDGAKLAFEFTTTPPKGAELDPASGEFSWKAADTLAAGTYEIGLRVDVEGDPGRFATGKLAVNVASGPPSTTPGSTGAVATVKPPAGPTESEIEDAEKLARELFRREITKARSVTERIDLAARMLTRAKEAGEMPLALGLFRLAHEYALKGRSQAIALEAVRTGSGRFGLDLVTQTTECLAVFKPRGSTWFDEQQVVEIGLAAAYAAVEAGRYQEAEKLMTIPESVLRRGRQFDEADRLKSGLDFLKTVRAEVPDENSPVELSESAMLARKELLATLERFQFESVFARLADASFFRHTEGDLPDQGRSLWKIDDGTAAIEVPKQPVNTGFVDRAHSLTAFTLRMNVSTDTTAGMLCIGVPQSGSFEGLRLHLGAQQFCFLRRASGKEFFARPGGPITRSRGGWDQIEVRAVSGQVTVLVNNSVVIDTAVDAETSGFVGLDAFLGNASPARVRLENVRVRAEQ